MKFSVSVKKPSGDENKASTSNDITKQFSESDGGEVQKEGDTKPYHVKINFKETEEPVDDSVLTKYDEFVGEEKGGDLEPENLANGKTPEEKKRPARLIPRYVERLIKAAQKRKIEKELAKGNKEKENADPEKEVFVTSAYRKKLEEREQVIEKIKEQDEKDEKEAKDKDFNTLYKNILDSNMLKRKRTDN